MDKNRIKSFAVWARRVLITAVTEKANRLGITKNCTEEIEKVQGGFRLKGKEEIFGLPVKDREALVKQVNEKGFEQVMEEVAYTWFNRFMGLRYMEVNDYLPSGIRVLSSEVEGKTEPDVITRVTEVIDELDLNAEYVYSLVDSGTSEDREKLYKYILVRQCNELGRIIPQMFEKISDYTELLLPDNLLEEGSVIRRMVTDIDEEDWKEEVEIIGWMYQYYISEKKDEVFAALKNNVKITKENIPAATQLFTPKWIVKYMVENSLGRLWLEGHPNKELQEQWKYYLEEAEQDLEVEEELKKIREEHSKLVPEDIKVLDPCMGSGHILVYAFDVLYEIYKNAGYSDREIPRLILTKNLYGLDIDDRAAQLASFALIMKARHYNRRLFREIEKEHIELNLCSIQESNELRTGIGKEAIDYFISNDSQLMGDVNYLIDAFCNAKECGSIIEIKDINFQFIKQRLSEINGDDRLLFADYRKILDDKINQLILQAIIIGRQYNICITNPPYMNSANLNKKLKEYIEKRFSISKYDLYSTFIERCGKYCVKDGYYSLITQHSWMFLSSYVNLRKELLNKEYIQSMIHLGTRAFDDIGGEIVQTTSFVLRPSFNLNYCGIYIRLTEERNSFEKQKGFFENKNIFKCFNNNIKEIDEFPIAYWISPKVRKLFSENKKLGEIAQPRTGLQTSDTNRFLRLWHEVDINNIGFNVADSKDALESNLKWFPCNKGGQTRKWFGNNSYVVNWQYDGKEVKEYAAYLYKSYTRTVKNIPYYFRSGIAWTAISSSSFGVRYFKRGMLFDNSTNCLFCDDFKYNYYLAFLNSKLVYELLKFLNPTMNFTQGAIANLPFIYTEQDSIIGNIDIMVESNLAIAKKDWDSFEESWDFKRHPLISIAYKTSENKLSYLFALWESETEKDFNVMKLNEEELNRIFIDIYALEDELTPKLDCKDITIRRADRERETKSLISYAVGCILGRYSTETEGLIYAGGEFNDKWNLTESKVRKIEKDKDGNIINDTWVDSTFIPDADNVIPITDDEYFEDDIVSRFVEFIKVVYGEETLEENLDFIADSIGRKASETARQAIRRYFLKDFYSDHLKVYQKRPIYWLFNSGKADGFKALIYMHRYNESTVAKVRTDYLHLLQRKYEAEINRLALVIDSEEYSSKERVAARKKIEKLAKQMEECREYDQVVGHLANEKISIDLDDGVKVNYEKFQGVKVINSKGKEVKMDLLAKI
jgi:hypothetical protein